MTVQIKRIKFNFRPKHEKNDCTVRALANITNISYTQAHNLLKDFSGRKDRNPHWPKFYAILSQLPNWKIRIPASSCNLTISQFVKKHPKGRFYCFTGSPRIKHAFTIVDGIVMVWLNPKFKKLAVRKRIIDYIEFIESSY
jgi:hypothetical protein